MPRAGRAGWVPELIPAPASGEAEPGTARGRTGLVGLPRQRGAGFFLPVTVPRPCPASRKQDPGEGAGLWTDHDDAGPAL